MGESLSAPTTAAPAAATAPAGGEGWASYAPAILKGASSLIGSFGSYRSNAAERDAIDAIERQGESIRALREWEAKQLEAEGLSRFAGAQRKGLAEKQRGKLVASALTARAAAAGGGGDPTVMKLAAGIDAEAAYRMAAALAAGEEARKGYRTAAAGRRFEGAQALSGALSRASGMRSGMRLKGYGAVASALGEFAQPDFWNKFGEWFKKDDPPQGSQIWDNGG